MKKWISCVVVVCALIAGFGFGQTERAQADEPRRFGAMSVEKVTVTHSAVVLRDAYEDKCYLFLAGQYPNGHMGDPSAPKEVACRQQVEK